MKNVELTGVADFIKSLYTPPVEESVEESIELDEAIDFRKAHQEIMAYAKKSGGIDKTDFEKVAYYVKAIGDNQNTPNVANKAFMAMKKFVGDMDTDPRDGVMLMLKKHGMMKNGRLVQESITEGALGKQWVNGAKRVKSGSITLVKAKFAYDLHTVMKNGKKVGTFVFDDGPDAFSVTNMSTKKVSWADQIDDIPKMFESKAPALKSSDYAKGTYQSAQAFKDKFAKKKKEKKESVDEASKEGTVRIIDLGNKGQDKIRKELGVDKLPNKGFQVQVMTKGKFVNQGKPYKTMKDAEKVRSTGQHSMQKLRNAPKGAPVMKKAGKDAKMLRFVLNRDVELRKESIELDEAALEEKTKWKMGDGRPRNGPRIENERFWNLPYDSLKYIAKDAGEAMKANPTARKATTGPGNWADQVADAATVMQWRKKNGIKEEVELDEQKMDQKMFDSLKKGDKLSVSFGSGIRKDNNVTLQVKSKSKSAKYNLEKINCFNVQNPGGMKYTIYNRQGKFSLAQGDMGTHSADFVKESVDEAKKPVSQMTPAEKAADAKRRKEYNAFQKSKRNETTQGIDARTKTFKEKVKKLAYMKDSSIKTRKLMGAYDMKTSEGNKKVAFAISKAKNEEDLLARLESISKMGEGQYAEAISRNVFEKAVVQFRKK